MKNNSFSRDYVIGGVRFRVIAPGNYEDDSGYSLFVDISPDANVKPDVIYNISYVDKLDALPAKSDGECAFVYENARLRIYRRGGKTVRRIGYYCGGKLLSDEIAEVIYSENSFEQADVRLVRGCNTPIACGAVYRTLCIEHLFASHNAVILHSSYIDTGRGAVLFTAPSETGKSTQAELWKKYKNAAVINGDCTLIRRTPDGFFACGLPFAGTSGIMNNVTLPLAGVVRLYQSGENRITRLSGLAAFRSVYEGCWINIWDKPDVERVSKLLSELASDVPVFRLDCLPSRGAVELLYDNLFSQK